MSSASPCTGLLVTCHPRPSISLVHHRINDPSAPISYAVFCLKKKKKHPDVGRDVLATDPQHGVLVVDGRGDCPWMHPRGVAERDRVEALPVIFADRREPSRREEPADLGFEYQELLGIRLRPRGPAHGRG